MSEEEQKPEAPAPVSTPVSQGSVGLGILLGFGSAVATAAAGGVLAAAAQSDVLMMIGLAPSFGVGLTQLLWVIPMVIHLRKQGKRETAKGVIIAASILFLLNAGCWGILATATLDFR